MRKGISSLIGVILSLSFVIILAAVVFNFTKTNFEDKLSKVSDSELESYCLLHVDLETRNACYYSDELNKTLVKINVVNSGDSKISGSTLVRFNGECIVAFEPIYELNPFESKVIDLVVDEGCGVPIYGEFIPYVEIENGIYNCGVKSSFDVVKCLK